MKYCVSFLPFWPQILDYYIVRNYGLSLSEEHLRLAINSIFFQEHIIAYNE